MTDHVLVPKITKTPQVFTQEELDWAPWLEPVKESDLTERQYDGLVDRARAKNPYFRLLAHDPDILGSRTKTDKDIFYNPEAGLPRAERELAAAATSRYNGCIYCASVHSRFASFFSKKTEVVQQLLDEGVSADLGERWNALVEFARALTHTPSQLTVQHIEQVRAIGLDDAAIADLIQSSAFFNWANRLMLSLGEPAYPEK